MFDGIKCTNCFVSAVTSVLILFDNLKTDFFSQSLEPKIKATLVRNVY